MDRHLFVPRCYPFGEGEIVMFFDPGIIDAIRNTLPGLGDFFLFVTQIGSEIFYIVLLLIGYWAFNKRESIIATYVLVIAVLSNYWLKYIIANNRPPASYYLPGADYPNYSTPSGHSQYSATFYGWLTVRTKAWWIALIGIILTFLIGISRIYIGVHFLGDVLIGWGVGILIVIVIYYLEKPAREYLSKYKLEHLLFFVFFVGLVMLIVATFLPAPPNDNFGNVGGLTMGLALGLVLEERFVQFSVEPHNGQKLRLILRVVIGLILVIGVMFGLAPILPSEDILLRSVRYFLTALMGVFIWPAIFKKANL
ncbi:MAG: phosphatase PAP2 family protein [Candidatus Thorarchaeota archaeon]